MTSPPAEHIRGIDAFIQRFAGTQDPAVPLTVRRDESDIRPGLSVYAGQAKLAVVALGPEDTPERLSARLHELRRAQDLN